MSTIALILLTWLVASVPLGIVVGRALANAERRDLSRYIVIPRGDDQ